MSSSGISLPLAPEDSFLSLSIIIPQDTVMSDPKNLWDWETTSKSTLCHKFLWDHCPLTRHGNPRLKCVISAIPKQAIWPYMQRANMQRKISTYRTSSSALDKKPSIGSTNPPTRVICCKAVKGGEERMVQKWPQTALTLPFQADLNQML